MILKNLGDFFNNCFTYQNIDDIFNCDKFIRNNRIINIQHNSIIFEKYIIIFQPSEIKEKYEYFLIDTDGIKFTQIRKYKSLVYYAIDNNLNMYELKIVDNKVKIDQLKYKVKGLINNEYFNKLTTIR